MKPFVFFCLILFSPLSFSQEIPLNDFVRHGDYFDMKISPDGKHLLARARADGIVGLLFLEADTMKFIGGVRPREGDQIHSAQWINNERVIYQYAEKRLSYDKPIATGEIFATNIDGSKAEFLYGFRAGEAASGSRISRRGDTRATPYIISLLEGDDDNILIIEHPWTQINNTLYDLREKTPVISKLNIYNGRKRKVENLPHPGAQVLATTDGQVNFMAWRDEQNNAYSAYRKKADSPWIDVKSAFNTDMTLIPVAINNTSDKVYFSGNLGDKALQTVFEFDLNTNAFKTVFDDMSTDIMGWTLDHFTNQPIIAYSQPAKTIYHYADSDNERAKLHQMLVEAFGKQTVQITSQSDDGQKLLVHVSSDINPGEFYIFNSKTMNAQFLWANRSWLDPRKMHAKQPMSFTTKDGVEVHGYLTMPNLKDEQQKPPLVVMIHGGPHGARDYWDFNTETQLFANRGYAVLQVNFRGSGGYGERFEELGYRQWGGKMIDDIIEVTQLTINQDKVDGNRVCAYGASYGGYAALMSVIRAPDMFKCTIGYVGIYNLHYAFSHSDTIMMERGKSYLEKVLGTDDAILDEFSPINHVNEIKANVMLLHGEKDARVPVINAEKMHEKLLAAGKTVPYLNFAKSGHGVYDERERKQLYIALLEFLQQNIGNTK
jgi:dipeptidyl aminopeptidase/acylaminoacyl peptidase